jgi:hypothetical protein
MIHRAVSRLSGWLSRNNHFMHQRHMIITGAASRALAFLASTVNDQLMSFLLGRDPGLVPPLIIRIYDPWGTCDSKVPEGPLQL